MSIYIDLTHPLTENTPVFLGDPEFKCEQVEFIEKGSSYNLYKICLGNHSGTHIDFPRHVLQNGKNSNDYTLNQLCGDGVVIEYTDDSPGISSEFIKNQRIKDGDIVFFKTKNSAIPANTLVDEFTYLKKDGAQALIDKKVRIVGIDYMSIDALHEEDLPSHHALLENDTLIVENLNTKNITAGRYYFFIIPMNIPDMDGLPVRVFARAL